MTNAPRIDNAYLASLPGAETGRAKTEKEPQERAEGPPGMAESAAAFLPHPWVDLGKHSVVEPALDLTARISVDRPSDVSVQKGALDQAVKRALDVALSALALILLAPLLGFLAILLRAEGGSVVFAQTRVGRGRTRFRCLKLRTMRPNAESDLARLLHDDPVARAEWALHQKLKRDPRITPLGRFLRETSLDELPQLINVIRGDMSLVGPRPIVAPESVGYHGDRAYYRNPAFEEYVRVRPGVTGLWQVSGRHSTSYGERVRLDRAYVRTRTLWLDLKIMWRTIGVVLGRTGR